MEYRLVKEEGFEYIEEGKGPTMVLLHGLFGALSNWNDVLKEFSKFYTVMIPLMPIYSNTRVSADVEGLMKFVSEFINFKKINGFSLIGNSLGGHVALLYTLAQPQRVANLILTGSSGLFEAGMGIGFPRRGDYQYIRERVEYTFYSPKTATKELV
ncbi:MAG: alpha/beta hydrolase, partial [Bacteroidia bacterium]|nr:alpha/beta hydrolase [Bacteroidia bacterium]